MNLHWYGISITCPDCKKDATLQMCAYASDGEIRFTFYCFQCKALLHWNVFASQLQNIAICNDINNHCKKCRQVPTVAPPLQPPLQPPLLISPTLMTEEDKRWERAMGIDPDDNNKKE